MRLFSVNLCQANEGQDVAEYAIMLVVILVIVIGMIRMIGSNAQQCLLPSRQQNPIARVAQKRLFLESHDEHLARLINPL